VSRTPAVPYCTVKGFRRCLDILRVDAPDRRIDRRSLVESGISTHAVYPVLGALRFLGLIDGHGQRTPELQSFLDPDDLPGRRVVVERAYAEILETVDFPVEEREDVDLLLIERHGCAQGVAAFCSTFFLWLAAESGLPVAPAGRSRRGRPPAHLAQLSDVARGVLEKRAAENAGLPAAFSPAEAALSTPPPALSPRHEQAEGN
jgi:hypothetical protein